MRRAVVSVRRAQDEHEHDLDLSVDLPMAELANAVAEALGWSAHAGDQRIVFDLEADPPGRTLLPYETLADAGAWDGARIVFRPRAGPARPRPSLAAREDHSNNDGNSGETNRPQPQRFVWKRLEEEGG